MTRNHELEDMINSMVGQALQQGPPGQGADLSLEEMQLPMDEALEVGFRSVDGDEFDESHLHTIPADDIILLHLTPGHAQIFDQQFRQFVARHDIGGDTSRSADPHEDDYCVVCGAEPSVDGPAMHPVASIKDGCVCSDCVSKDEL